MDPYFKSEHHDHHDHRRRLSGDNGNFNYPSYSVAWRYLGLFIDCSDYSDDDGQQYYCTRKVLWAAYLDQDYEGGSIGEYSYFDRSSSTWDTSTCLTDRCKRMDCHEPDTSFELVGIFKETDGLEDWTEQLFKHAGYCLWGEDYADDDGGGSGDDDNYSDYNFMENQRENLITECTYLNGYADSNGNALYVDTKPVPGGNMEYGLYSDKYCNIESTASWSDYLLDDNDDRNSGSGDYSISEESLDRWNDLLGDYKVCQPCRAYGRVRENNNNDSGDDGDDDEEWGDNDGEGDNEKWGFNCYDDAGYTNCNQCYKFQSQTDMEEATIADLEAATSQGTILAINVDGVTYGGGTLASNRWSPSLEGVAAPAVGLALVASVVGVVVCFLANIKSILFRNRESSFLFHQRRRRVNNENLKEKLYQDEVKARKRWNGKSKKSKRSSKRVVRKKSKFEDKERKRSCTESDGDLQNQERDVEPSQKAEMKDIEQQPREKTNSHEANF